MPHAKLLVSCFSRFGLDFPLKPSVRTVGGVFIIGFFLTSPSRFEFLEAVSTCFPQQGSLLVVGVEGFSKAVRLQQAVQQLEELL